MENKSFKPAAKDEESKGDKCDRCGKRSWQLLPAYDPTAPKGVPKKNPKMICNACACKDKRL